MSTAWRRRDRALRAWVQVRRPTESTSLGNHKSSPS
jgi:hypothetical protein